MRADRLRARGWNPGQVDAAPQDPHTYRPLIDTVVPTNDTDPRGVGMRILALDRSCQHPITSERA